MARQYVTPIGILDDVTVRQYMGPGGFVQETTVVTPPGGRSYPRNSYWIID
jgi:hypothetical protein